MVRMPHADRGGAGCWSGELRTRSRAFVTHLHVLIACVIYSAEGLQFSAFIIVTFKMRAYSVH